MSVDIGVENTSASPHSAAAVFFACRFSAPRPYRQPQSLLLRRCEWTRRRNPLRAFRTAVDSVGLSDL